MELTILSISVKQVLNKPKTQEGGLGEDIGGGASACNPPEVFIKGGEDDEYIMDWNSQLYLHTLETKESFAF